MILRNNVVRSLSNLEKRYRSARECKRWRDRHSFVFRSNIQNPPNSIRVEAINAVWKDYWKTDPKWAQYYWSINGIASPYYIPSDFYFTKLCKTLNSIDRFGWPLFQDKNYIDLIFRGVRQPDTIVRNVSGQYLDNDYQPLTVQEAVALCEKEDDLIIKPSVDSKMGRNIEFITQETKKDSNGILSVLQNKGEDFVVQRVLCQHHKMAELNPDSINTVRVQTLLWKGHVYILSALVRIGVKGCRIDNPHTSNGVSCVLTPEGKMIGTAYDRDWRPYKKLQNGIPVRGFEVPYYDRIIDAVIRLQYRVPHFRLVGWDMTVSEDGEPIMIEANLDTPEIYFHQLGTGPLIKDPDLFCEVMDFVSGRGKE